MPANCPGGFALSPLGREVAVRLRPEPWRADIVGTWCAIVRPDGEPLEVGGEPDFELCKRIAALLTADDLRAAKTYKTET